MLICLCLGIVFLSLENRIRSGVRVINKTDNNAVFKKSRCLTGALLLVSRGKRFNDL